MSIPIIALMIPIVAIVMGIGIGMLRLWLDYRNKRDMFKMHHAERIAAIERGIELPPLPPQFFQDYPYPRGASDSIRYLRNGLVLLLVGGAVFLALDEEGGLDAAWWGLVPAAVGAAFLLFYVVAARKLGARNGDAGSSPSSGSNGGPNGSPNSGQTGAPSGGAPERSGPSTPSQR